MSALSKLTLVVGQKPEKADKLQLQRNKLAGRIDEQLALVQAQLSGSTYAPTRTKRVHNELTGEIETEQVPKRVKTWFWQASSGKYQVAIYYGAKLIELAKGKTAVEVDSLDAVAEALSVVKAAVVHGELDAAISSVSAKLRAGFAK
jgi:hypothetical protein